MVSVVDPISVPMRSWLKFYLEVVPYWIKRYEDCLSLHEWNRATMYGRMIDTGNARILIIWLILSLRMVHPSICNGGFIPNLNVSRSGYLKDLFFEYANKLTVNIEKIIILNDKIWDFYFSPYGNAYLISLEMKLNKLLVFNESLIIWLESIINENSCFYNIKLPEISDRIGLAKSL